MFMKFFRFFKKPKSSGQFDSFSDFFLHASEKQQEDVIRQAAQKANEDQLKTFEKSQMRVRAKT